MTVGALFLHSSADLYGSDKSLLRIVCALDPKIFRPCVILPCEGPLATKIKEKGIAVRIMKLGILRQRHAHPLGVVILFFQGIWAVIRLGWFIRSTGISLVVSNTLAVVAGGPAALLGSVPHVWYVREIVESPAAVKRFLAFLLRHFADKVLAVSQAVRLYWEGIQPKLAKKMVVVHNGLDEPLGLCGAGEARAQWGLPAGCVLVGMIGRINRVKGHVILLQAARELVRKYPETLFLCVGDTVPGDSWRREELVERIVQEGLREKFLLKDFSEDVGIFYSAVDIVAVPSIAPDAFPTVCIEAGLFGKPVVAFNMGGIGEMVQDSETGFCVAPEDFAGFRNRLEQLIVDRSLRERLGRKAKEFCRKNFPLSQQIDSLQKLFLRMALGEGEET